MLAILRDLETTGAAIAAIFQAALELGGTLSGEHGIGLLKAPFFKAELGDDGLAVMESIKRILDPGNILNPGKMLLRCFTH
ncbi:FAD-binding oxidoreductase [Moorella sp. Hama-1]|uniref:FAD-binding oxidoreductase n=1 Tax=Moorella sp. Hama-1 TaxID=2138101 RepID=UPI000D645751|nr:FAD-linked oxidase C-terminal domain-containing protein [Moorella sp. Hama-1]BCV22747.1 hypothetical protein hamaS1_28160 [Moorella sp. Hama-1]